MPTRMSTCVEYIVKCFVIFNIVVTRKSLVIFPRSSQRSTLYEKVSNHSIPRVGVVSAMEDSVACHVMRFRTSSSVMADRSRKLGDFKKARVNGGTDNHSLKGFSQVSPLPLTDLHHMVIK